MALVAEELVQEWLNRLGFFTIRGVKVGVYEMDLLAIRPRGDRWECWHYEVVGALRPMSYVTPLPKEIQKRERIGPRNARKRTPEEMDLCVQDWVQKKYHSDVVKAKRQTLFSGSWHFAFVLAKARHPEEISLIEKHGIKVVWLRDILAQLKSREFRAEQMIAGATGADLVDLVLFEPQTEEKGRKASPKKDFAGAVVTDEEIVNEKE